MSPKGGSGRRDDADSPRRGIGAGGARSAASRLRAVRIALAHDLIRAGRILDRRGMLAASEGALSARLAGDRVLLTRRKRRKGDLTPRDFVELGILEPLDSASREAASIEHRIHLAAYGARRDVEAIVQAHPVALTAFALRGRAPDIARVDAAGRLLGAIGLVPRPPAGTDGWAEAVASSLDAPGVTPPSILILEDNGALAVGADVEEALSRLEVAEHLAAAFLLAERISPR